MKTAAACPNCSSPRTRLHCDPSDPKTASHTCDLILCTGCKGWGRPDGARWVNGGRA